MVLGLFVVNVNFALSSNTTCPCYNNLFHHIFLQLIYVYWGDSYSNIHCFKLQMPVNQLCAIATIHKEYAYLILDVSMDSGEE
jgi:hypothetical protein